MGWKPSVSSSHMKLLWWRLIQCSTSRMLHLTGNSVCGCVVCTSHTQTKLPSGFILGNWLGFSMGRWRVFQFFKAKEQNWPKNRASIWTEVCTRLRRSQWWPGGSPGLCRIESASRCRPGWSSRSHQRLSQPKTTTYGWRPPPSPPDWQDLHGEIQTYMLSLFETPTTAWSQKLSVSLLVLMRISGSAPGAIEALLIVRADKSVQ